MSAKLPYAPPAALGTRRRHDSSRPADRPAQVAPRPQTLAVAIHDIEPATYARCALIRDWLGDHGVKRVTLLVIPARDLHPFDSRAPEMVDWLVDCRRRGDAIAQHGFVHSALVSAANGWRLPGAVARRADAEFRGLDAVEARRAVDAGWRVLKLAGVEPSGFVAPAYAYTRALRETLCQRFDWWAGRMRLHATDGGARRELLAPAVAFNGVGPVRRAVSPVLVRAGALLAADTLRLDLRPSDLEHAHQMDALERTLASCARRRTAVTYDELVVG